MQLLTLQCEVKSQTHVSKTSHCWPSLTLIFATRDHWLLTHLSAAEDLFVWFSFYYTKCCLEVCKLCFHFVYVFLEMCFPTEVSEAVIISSFPDPCVLGHKIQVVTCLLPDVGYHIMCSTGEKYAQNHRFLRTSATYSRNNIPGVHHAEAVTAGCYVCSHMLTAWTTVPQAVRY